MVLFARDDVKLQRERQEGKTMKFNSSWKASSERLVVLFVSHLPGACAISTQNVRRWLWKVKLKQENKSWIKENNTICQRRIERFFFVPSTYTPYGLVCWNWVHGNVGHLRTKQLLPPTFSIQLVLCLQKHLQRNSRPTSTRMKLVHNSFWCAY